MEHYGSAISTSLSSKQAASLCCHPINVGKEKAMCFEHVELAQSHVAIG